MIFCGICGKYHNETAHFCGGTVTFEAQGLSQSQQSRIAELERQVKEWERLFSLWGEKRPSELSDEDFIVDVKRDIAKCSKDREQDGFAGICDHCYSYARLLQMLEEVRTNLTTTPQRGE